MAKKEEKNFAIVFQGKTWNRTPYTVSIKVVDAKIQAIDINGKPNLHVQDLCKKFEQKHPENIEDVAGVIKLEMLKFNEYIKEVRQ